MNSTQPEARRPRVSAAWGVGGATLSAVEAAAEIAARLGGDLEARLIEDANLIRLALLPIGRQLASHTGRVEPLEPLRLEAELRTSADRARQILARTAAGRQLHWTFTVVRGSIERELGAAAGVADLLIIGRHPPLITLAQIETLGCSVLWLSEGLSARAPVALVVEAGDRGVDFARQTARAISRGVVREISAARGIAAALGEAAGGVLVLSANSRLLSGEEARQALSRGSASILVCRPPTAPFPEKSRPK